MYRPSRLEIQKILLDHQRANGKLADFSNMDLRGIAFDGRDLVGANFSGADCSTCSFRFCALQNVSFANTHIGNADFYRAIIHTSPKGKSVYIEPKAKDRPLLTIDQIDMYDRNTIINLDDCNRLFWDNQ